MRNQITILFLFISTQVWAQLNPEPKKISEEFFPDPDIEISTPAFDKKKGFTDYDEMMTFLNKLQYEHPEVLQIEFIGKSQKGKSIPLVRLNKKSDFENKLRVWIQGGLHGNEPGSTESTFYLMNKLLGDEDYSHLLDRLELAIVPMANIDGYEKDMRDAINGLDLNRDQTKLSAPESVVLKKAFSNFSPEVALDLHEYNAYRKHYAQLGTYGISSIYDVMFLYTGNLNVPQNLRKYIERPFIANAREKLDEHYLRHNDYMSTTEYKGEIQFKKGATSPRSSATNYALNNCVAALIEVRGVHLDRTSFKRRVLSAFLVSSSFLQTAYDQVDEVRAEIKQANSNRAKAVVKSKRSVYDSTIEVLDLDSRSKIEFEVTFRDALKSKPSMERERATAYLIPKEQEVIIEKLSILGLELNRLPTAAKLEVQTYTVSEYEKDPEKFEDIHVQTVTTKLKTEQIAFPEGTAVLLMNQAKSNLAIEVLEPETQNSFVSYQVLPTELEDKLPIYRYVLSDGLETLLKTQKP
ncbi:MAG: M14 family zinc carboxypeptidase [Vicingaceae bacterium]